METFELLKDNLVSISEGKIVRGKNNPVFGIVMLLLGVIVMCFSSTSYVVDPTSILLFFSIGLCVFVLGIVKLFSHKDIYIDTCSGKKMKEYELGFDISESEKLISLYENRNFENMASLKRNVQPGVLINVIGNSDGTLFYTQVMKYVPYKYVPVNNPVEHKGQESEALKNLIASYSKK